MEIGSIGTEQCGYKGFSKSNQGSLHYDLNHDKIHPDHFIKGQEFASLFWFKKYNILFFSIKSYWALSLCLLFDKNEMFGMFGGPFLLSRVVYKHGSFLTLCRSWEGPSGLHVVIGADKLFIVQIVFPLKSGNYSA